jgi:uncharacterized iron-regulated membrane protein
MGKLPVKTWFEIHKWSSLICTVFLLVICVTGLPLVFKDEINDLLDDGAPYTAVPEGTPTAPLDSMIAAGKRMYPN